MLWVYQGVHEDVSVKEFVALYCCYLSRTDTDTGESRELLVGRHDCESALKDYAKYDVLCSDHTDECVDVDLDNYLRITMIQ